MNSIASTTPFTTTAWWISAVSTLDVLKDRLYTAPARSAARCSAQTVLYEILVAVLKIMAPILSFTADEAWWQSAWRLIRPCRPVSIWKLFPTSILTTTMPALKSAGPPFWRCAVMFPEPWKSARQAKVIGHSLDARVALGLPEDLRAALGRPGGIVEFGMHRESDLHWSQTRRRLMVRWTEPPFLDLRSS